MTELHIKKLGTDTVLRIASPAMQGCRLVSQEMLRCIHLSNQRRAAAYAAQAGILADRLLAIPHDVSRRECSFESRPFGYAIFVDGTRIARRSPSEESLQDAYTLMAAHIAQTAIAAKTWGCPE